MSVFKTMTAHEAKNRFGEAIINVQASPVTVTKNGKPVMVMMSMDEFNAIENLKAKYEVEQIRLGQEDIKAGRYLEGTEVFDKLLGL